MTPPHGEPQPDRDDRDDRDQGQQPPYGDQQQRPYGDQGQPPYGEQGQQRYDQPYGQPPYGQPYPPAPQAYGQPGYGPPGYGAVAGPAPDSRLVWAILSTVLCCPPLGIVSIIKSSQVSTLWAQGQYDAARKASDDAKKWAIWSAIAAGVLYLVIIVFYAVIFAIYGGNLETS